MISSDGTGDDGVSATNWLTRLGTALLYAAAGFLIVSAVLVAGLRWIDPSTSSFMLQQQIAGSIGGSERPSVYHEWVDWEAIAPSVPLYIALDDSPTAFFCRMKVGSS